MHAIYRDDQYMCATCHSLMEVLYRRDLSADVLWHKCHDCGVIVEMPRTRVEAKVVQREEVPVATP